MMLYGFGDPTGGLGGLSYVKKPLKARGEKDSKNMAVVEKKPVVMGTDDDLRKLHVNDTRAILLKLGADNIANLKRWKMIDLIAKITQ
jgi:transcription initiation factor TFIID subunit 1